MKNRSLIILVVIAAACATARPPAMPDLAGAREQVRQAEIAFASAFRDRDSARFFALVDPDANFLTSRGPTLHGKSEVTAAWSKLFNDATPPFAWEPARVEVNGDGTIGLSTGPVTSASGKHIGDYASIWRKQADGSWKIIFDGPGCSPQ